MIRYETKESTRFWEVQLVGCDLTVRHGSVGQDGKATTKTLQSEAAARKEMDRRIRATEKKGYERVVFGDDPQPGNVELEQSIIGSSAEDALQVYGDWLQAQGDPRGELAALQHALSSKPDPKLERSVAKLLAQHGAYLLPPRLAEALRKRQTKGKAPSGYCSVEWRCGFIHGARIGRNSAKPPYTVRELTAMLLAHPSARLLRELEIGALGTRDETQDYRDVVSAILAARPPALRRLALASFTPEHCELESTFLGDIGALSAALPHLEQLTLRGGSLSLEGARFDSLTTLELECDVMDRTLQEMAQLSWPALQSLTLHHARRPAKPTATAALLERLAGTEVKRLGLVACEDSGKLLDALLESPLLAQLEALDLSGGTLTDDGAARLVGSRARLRWLGVDNNHLTEAARPGLEQAATELLFGTQRPLPIAGLTMARVRSFAGDSRTLASARGLATASQWNRLGLGEGLLWGEYTGSSTYEVFARVEGNDDAACTCPSFRHPCKHAVGLLLMAAEGQPIPKQAAPAGLVQRCEAERYSSSWE